MPRPRPKAVPDGDTPHDHSYAGRAAFSVPYSVRPNGKPSDEYLAALVAEMDAAGLTVKLRSDGSRYLSPERGKPSEDLLDRVKHSAEYVVEYLKRTRGLLAEPVQKLPEPGHVIEWIDDSDHFRHVCVSDELPANWLAWRYRNTRRWYAYSGYSWEE